MKKSTKALIIIIFLGLLSANIYVFVSGMSISEEINKYEAEIKKLHLESAELERDVYAASSFQYAASAAALLDFNRTGVPHYLDNLGVAKKR